MSWHCKQPRVTLLLALLASCLLWVACSTTRTLNEHEHLLLGNAIKFEQNKHTLYNKKMDELREKMTPIIKQKPNKQLLGLIPFNLMVYNLAGKGKERKWKIWIKNTIGEAPVIIDTSLIRKTADQFELFLFNKGYFHARVKDSVVTKHKKSSVFYLVNIATPYTIRYHWYKIEDAAIARIVQSEDSLSLIKPDDNYDADMLQKERDRLTARLKNMGYYYFTKDDVYFQGDSMPDTHQVDIYTGIKRANELQQDSAKALETYRIYHIRNIYVETDYDPRASIDTLQHDTLSYVSPHNADQQINILYIKANGLPFKPQVLSNSIYVVRNGLYRLQDADATYKRLSDLGMFRYINISFNKTEGADSLDCIIQLAARPSQGYGWGFETTYSSPNYGIAPNVFYQNRNLLGGIELFELKIKGAVEAQKTVGTQGYGGPLFNTYELRPEAKLDFQKFPFGISFRQINNPQTTLSSSFDFQQRPAYTRQMLNFSYGTTWRSTPTQSWLLHFPELNFIQVKTTDAFQHQLDASNNPVLISSYQPHFIPAVRGQWTYSEQPLSSTKNYFFFQGNLELAVIPMPDFITRLVHQPNSQYIRPEADYRFYQRLNKHQTMVYRLYGGYGYSYAKSLELPFEKAFYIGGANDIRAWAARTIGPGSYSTTANDIERIGDIKLESNAEYRFDIINIIQGALFIDAGNIWTRNDTARADSRFLKNGNTLGFLNEVAIGTGFGIRLNFPFFIFRFDFGIPLKDPSAPLGESWVITKLNSPAWQDAYKAQYGYKYGFTVINFGIGYPF